MGLFSSIGKLLGADSSKYIQQGKEQDLAFQREALDYQKSIDALPLQYRNQALGQLSDYYMGGPESQQQFYDNAMNSPAYQNYMQQGEESILRNAAATGGVRGGAVNPALALNSFNVAQGLVDRNLQGIGSFANPSLNTQGITNTLGNMGATSRNAAIAQGQNQQNLAGLGLNALSSLASASNSFGLWG